MNFNEKLNRSGSKSKRVAYDAQFKGLIRSIFSAARSKSHLPLVILLLLCTVVSMPAPEMEDEYLMKTFYFKSFSSFITWPTETNVFSQTETFVIGVYGENPFAKNLEAVYVLEEGNKIKNKNVNVRYVNSPEQINGCHILFISSSEDKNLETILTHTRNQPVLTIGDSPGFGARGVHINLYIQGNKVRFEINEPRLRKDRFKVNIKLLSIAKIVNTPGD